LTFEGLNEIQKEYLLNFVKEMADAFHKEGLTCYTRHYDMFNENYDVAPQLCQIPTTIYSLSPL